MKNISKKLRSNIDAIAEAKKDKNFQRDSEEISVRIKLAVEIYNARGFMSLSQQRLAKEIGTTQREISRLENGDVDVRLGLLNRITKKLSFTSNNFAKVFGCDTPLMLLTFSGKDSKHENTNINNNYIGKINYRTNSNTINK